MKTSLLSFGYAVTAATIILLSVVRAEIPALDEAALRKRMAAGDFAAQFKLGIAFLRGEGVVKNLPEAFTLLKGAAESGHAESMGAFGFMVAKGMAATVDESAGLEWIRRSVAAGVVSSKLNLGIMTLKGQGTTSNPIEGLKLITEAASSGNVDAQVRLSEIYFFGEAGVRQAPDQAATWAVQAAEAGNAWAQNLVGTMKEHATGLPLDLTGAAIFYRKAAEQGNAKAQANLGMMLHSGLAGKPDPVQAFYWLKAAMDQGEITGRNFLGETQAGFTAEQIKEAETLAEKKPAPVLRRRGGPPGKSWLPHPTSD